MLAVRTIAEKGSDRPSSIPGQLKQQSPDRLPRIRLVVGVVLLLFIMFAELALSVRRQSQTFDEACHIFAGYRYWKNFDFGINPEHPPLVKLVATLPLLRLSLRTPAIANDYFRVLEFESGREFLYTNDANALLWRARLAAALFTIALALAVFLIANSMWGAEPAFLALVLFAFDPNFIAHGALVTTDIAASLGLFLGVASFYLYMKKPSALRLAGAGLAAGVCLGAKHSGILLFPVLFVLAFVELLPLRDPATKQLASNLWKKASRLGVSLAVILVIAWAALWALYGFRYATRPSGLEVNPPFSEFATHTNMPDSGIILKVAQWRLLPESYLYGIVNVYSPGAIPTALFGKHYATSQWFYFPVIFVIKSTLAFLLFCGLAPLATALWGRRYRREVLFLVVPCAIYFAAAMASGVNYGVRHLLPVYPFLMVLVSFGAWSLSQRHRALALLVAALIVFHAASSLRAAPNYIPYSNELWGGPEKTYRILTDSNVDWGQGLLAMKRYIEQRKIKNCWFAYSGRASVDVSYYGIPCQVLPTAFDDIKGLAIPLVPAQVNEPVFISSGEISGAYWKADWANPYLPFRRLSPSAVIAGSILVYDGRVDISQLCALTHEKLAMKLLRDHQMKEALSEAETAIDIAPDRPIAHATRSMILSAMGRKEEAGEEIVKARTMAANILAGHQ
jgi:4-amino-4-deoxy-L-arabinose transferase-like glycosyltransferase